MKLDDFIKSTLLSITNGVSAAQNESLLFIAPAKVNDQNCPGLQNVHFEVMVTVSKDGKAGISVLNIGECKAGVSSQELNKISFDVPVCLQAPTKHKALEQS